MNKDAIVEGLKELIRTSLIAVVPVLIDSLSAGEVNLRLVAISAAIAALRALDKILHESDVKTPLDLKSLDSLK